ncbi:predicted protein [Arabidopsis lyrata subsp. lyrata]|uniref:Predicted protein n=1 Tax=Arabidopsis lyrata subsp. lyrata TaxID=81972 RepID=D7KJ09_ARALL|nr:predicted protein [Arabidopsis lyrata subsp. lyrata]
MGIVGFQWGEGNYNQLTLLMNRDNYILSGRCQDNGGSWFGISRGGRVAFLVSGDLLVDRVLPHMGSELYLIEFLAGNMTPQEFANDVARRNEMVYLTTFSLIVADMPLNSMVHIRKLQPMAVESEIVPFGVHTLSAHGGLDGTLPRDLLMRGIYNLMYGNNPLPPLELARRCMSNAEGGPHDALYLDKMVEHFEKFNLTFFMVHPCTITNLFLFNSVQYYGGHFGTTSTTALVVERTGRVRVFERYMMENGTYNTHDFDFDLQIGQ